MAKNIIYENSAQYKLGEYFVTSLNFTMDCYTAVIEKSTKFLFWTFYSYEIVQTYTKPDCYQKPTDKSMENALFRERELAQFFLDKWRIQNKHYEVKDEWFKPNTKQNDNTSEKTNNNGNGITKV